MHALNLAFLINDLGGCGGTERVLSRVSNELAGRGHDIHLLSRSAFKTTFFGYPSSANRHVLQFGKASSRAKILRLILELAGYIKREHIDILVVVDTCHCYFAVPAGLLAGCPTIAWEHFNLGNDLVDNKPTLSYGLAARFADRYVCISGPGLSEHREFGLVPEQKLALIPNPLSFDFPDDPGVSPEKRILFVGRFSPQKNPIDTLRAWERSGLSSEGWNMTFVGEGSLREGLEEYIRSKDVRGVELAGRSSDVGAWYRRSRVLCGSSTYEGFGLVIIEAASYGVPSVFYDCSSGPASLIHQGKTGYLIELGDIEGMAAAMRALAHLSAGEERRMHDACRDAASRYEISAIGDAWERLLVDVLRRRTK